MLSLADLTSDSRYKAVTVNHRPCDCVDGQFFNVLLRLSIMFGWFRLHEADIIGPLRIGRISLLMAGIPLTLALSGSFVAQRGGFGGPSGTGNITRGGDTQSTISVQPPAITDIDTVLLTVNVTGQQ